MPSTQLSEAQKLDLILSNQARAEHLESKQRDHKIDTATENSQKALNLVESHERICALRYESIDKSLASLQKLPESIQTLQRLSWMAMGCWTGTMVIGTVMGLIFVVMRIGSHPATAAVAQ